MLYGKSVEIGFKINYNYKHTCDMLGFLGVKKL